MSRLLSIQDLSVRFETDDGSITAVNRLSYALREGEILGIVGESGSGKSAHALAIMRLIEAPHGRIEAEGIFFRDRDLLQLPDRQMRDVRGREIAMVFQDPVSSLHPVFTIGFQIRESLRRHLGLRGSAASKRAAELLDRVGIPDAAERLRAYPHELSGGMRQRVMIAIAIAGDPKLIIADEPTTALDVTLQAQIVELIKRLHRELGLTVIWISHDLGVVAGLAETVNVMYAGHLMERGRVEDIYHRPRHPYTIGLLASIPRTDRASGRRLRPIPGRPPDLARLGAGCPFAPRCTAAEARCRTELPPLENAGSADHVVRCWRWQHTEHLRDQDAAGHA